MKNLNHVKLPKFLRKKERFLSKLWISKKLPSKSKENSDHLEETMDLDIEGKDLLPE